MKKKSRGKYESNVLPRLDFVTAAARKGQSEKEIAAALGVSYSTFREYKHKHPELLAALRMGASDASAVVENALFKRAHGYTEKVKKGFKLRKPVIENGRKVAETEVVELVEEEVHVPADIKAIIFWLTNRNSAEWRSSPPSGAASQQVQGNDPITAALLEEMVKDDKDQA